MKRSFFLKLFLFFISFVSSAETVCHFYHYTTEDGLPQYTIMDMLQDQKGFLWLATWDGLSKYDGYKFHNYKVQPGDSYIMNSNRIERIYLDKYSRIWMLSYDSDAHCFNPETEKFWGLQSIPNLDKSFALSKLIVNPSGKVWITSNNAGCVLIKDSTFNTQLFNKSNQSLQDNSVNYVFEDSNKNSWILTNNGMCLLKQNNEISNFLISDEKESEPISFYCAVELKNEIWFGSNNGTIWKYSKQKNTLSRINIGVTSKILSFINTELNEVVFLTSNDGFGLINTSNGQIKLFNKSNLTDLKSNNMQSACLDKSNRLWIETDELGIQKFDIKTLQIKYFFVKTDDVSTNIFPPRFILLEDLNSNIWIQPKGGGFSRYNPEKDILESFIVTAKNSDLKISNIIHSACTDKQGILWLCSRSHGLEKITFDKSNFQTMKINENNHTSVGNDVRLVFEDNEQHLWISTKDRRLTIFDADKKEIGCLTPEGKIEKNASFLAIAYSMMQDKDGNLWIGTKGDGLFKLRKKQNSKGYTIEHFENDIDNVFSLSSNNIYSVFQGKRGNIWIGTYGGGLNLVKYTPEGKTYFINSRNNLKNYPMETNSRVRFITEDNYGHICIGSTGGMVIFSSKFSIPENIDFKLYNRIPGEKESLSNNDVHNIFITKDHEMFIATFGGGINKVIAYDKNNFPLKFKQYMAKTGLPSDVVLSIQEDENKFLWISNENNLTKFNPRNETVETFSEISRIMSTSNFSEASTCKTASNELIFGYSNGIVSFKPDKIVREKYKPFISFTNFQLFNKDVSIGKDSPLTYSIDNLSELFLTHKQNFFNIEYAALDMINPENIIYAYKLEGFDNEWNYVQKQRIAYYTNLPKGEYVFKVKSTNSDGVWVENERQLSITVLPSFWETSFAYFLYIFFFILLVILCMYILITFYHLKANVVLEKKLSEMKLRFFTDISHEIRTPLTMITAPVEFLMTDKNTPDPIKKQLKMISQNTGRMLRLVNQILDFRKIQFLHLRVVETEISPFVEDICDNFREIADTQHIKFKFINQVGAERIWVDPDCLEKIVMNLLSNAFKYTPFGRSIVVILKNGDKYVTLEVHDQGPGLTKDKQKRLFIRFAAFNEDKSKPSTGIGLSMVKDLADKHSAKVTVESEEGKGSCFKVCFLKGISHFDNNVEIVADQNTSSTIDANKSDSDLDEKNAEKNLENSKGEIKPSVLIVEDDLELRSFMRSIIEAEYTIYEAENGVEGLENALIQMPDIIVSDIMMPKMDGIELLRKLKNEKATSHIPVILLTAKTNIESKLEGMTYGADDYITKPFSVPYFQARIINLLQQRKKLQAYYRSDNNEKTQITFDPQPFCITSQDDDMMKNVMQIIEENIDNSDFVVEELGQHVGMSRSVFFKKLKGLTGLAPIEFIRDVKMKRAAQILKSGEYMVKEVSYMIGISDTKYFSKCFKAKYGITPFEFKNQQAEEDN
ncbi:MAG: two-component regulator propeller domain-containing protein [Paludibacter sp.]|nr:two-component regulator propeller domain-containing protein [Paludibacter sp.]